MKDNKQTKGKLGNLPGAGPGRPKGSQNRTTVLLKDAILKAAHKAHEDGLVGYLQRQAVVSPGPFLALLGKVLPTQLTGEDGAAIKLETLARTIVDPNPDS